MSGMKFPVVNTKSTISRRFCCVYECRSLARRSPEISFHSFPKTGTKIRWKNLLGQFETVDGRQLWIRLLKMGKEPSKNMRVCSLHFVKQDYILPDMPAQRRHLNRNAYPSVNLPKTVNNPVLDSRKQRLELRKIKIQENAKRVKDRDINFQAISEEENEINDNNSTQKEPDLVTKQFRDVACQIKSGDLQISVLNFLDSNEKLNSATGLKDYDMANILVNIFKEIKPKKTYKNLSVLEYIIITFMKMKLKLTYKMLGILFRCTNVTCKNIIIETIETLAIGMKSIVFWPNREQIKNNMPKHFENFPNVRVVIDCIEIPLMRPKKLCCRIVTYSNYKSTYTVKFMTGVTPGGLLSFVSEAYGGRASDKSIFEQSKLITLLEPPDEIMCDKGFLIDNTCLSHGIKLCRPSFSKNKAQFSETESLLNREISKARVHIERVNQRIKIFEIFNKFPASLITRVNEVFFIACAIVNLSSPILAPDKFI